MAASTRQWKISYSRAVGTRIHPGYTIHSPSGSISTVTWEAKTPRTSVLNTQAQLWDRNMENFSPTQGLGRPGRGHTQAHRFPRAGNFQSYQ